MKAEPHLQNHSPADDCFLHLRRQILSRALAPGKQLPPERELATQLGVNRTTLRTALTRLESAGLIAARQGSGTLVRDFHHTGGPELLPELLLLTRDEGGRRQMLDDLLLMRRQMLAAVLARLSSGVAPLARTAVAAAIDGLSRTIAAGAATSAIAEADLAVLAAVLDATQSPVLAFCLNPISDAVRHSATLRHAIYAEPQSHLAGWLAVSDWLAAPEIAVLGDLLAAIDDRDAAALARLGADR